MTGHFVIINAEVHTADLDDAVRDSPSHLTLTLATPSHLRIVRLYGANLARFGHATVSLPGARGWKLHTEELFGRQLVIAEIEPEQYDYAFPEFPHWDGCRKCIELLDRR